MDRFTTFGPGRIWAAAVLDKFVVREPAPALHQFALHHGQPPQSLQRQPGEGPEQLAQAVYGRGR